MGTCCASDLLGPAPALRLRRQKALEELAKARREKTEATDKESACAEAVRLAQSAAAQAQKAAHGRLASLVSECLRSVFGEDAYEFKIVFEEKRGKTEARLAFARGGAEVDPLTASGGGVVDVAAFALRLSALLLHEPPLRRLLVLDEPWKHLSARYRPALRELVEVLARRLGVQFLIVTHSADFEIGKVITVSRAS